MGEGQSRAVDVSGIKYLKIIPGSGKSDQPAAFQTKIILASERDPLYALESVKELRSVECPLVYVGGGLYAPRANIARLEPLGDEERAKFASDKKARTDHFRTRVVLTGALGSFWGTKTIPELNERGLRFIDLGDGDFVHIQNIRKIGEIGDDERARIAERYGIDASKFRTEVLLQGAEKSKLTTMSMVEFRAAGLDLVDIGGGEAVLGSNIKFVGPFGTEDQERLAAAREGVDAEKFVSKITLAWGLAPVLSGRSLDALRASLKSVNIGYDRHVPADHVVAEKVRAFTNDDKSSLSELGNKVQRAWKSSVGLTNGRVLSPATPDQIRQRCEKALGAPTAPHSDPAPEASMG
jgi:hypothetical protein